MHFLGIWMLLPINWDVLMYGDYEAVMPLPWRRNGEFSYIYIPRMGSAIRCIFFKVQLK
jgi:hypothetical protein